MLASKRNGTLYVGVTSDLRKRMDELTSHNVLGFTQKYSVDQLVWCEEHDPIESAIWREKQLKKWNRAWKLELIESNNPDWKNLIDDFL